MKVRWLLAAACGIAMPLCAGTAAFAQDRDRPDQSRDQDRERMGHFTDHDRQELREWYREHSDWFEQYRHEGWRDDDLDQRMQPGSVLGEDMRRWSHPVPDEVMARMDPLPRYWRVVMIGDNAAIVDDNWTVRDVVHFDQFDNHDREVIRQWNHDHPDFVRGVLGGFGIRVDVGDLDRRLQVGAVVDDDLRQRAKPVPEELARELSPQPRDWRYVVIGDRLCLVDREWRVRESFRFEH